MDMNKMHLETERFEVGFGHNWRILLNGNQVAVATTLQGARSYVKRAQRFIQENGISTVQQFKAVDLSRGSQ